MGRPSSTMGYPGAPAGPYLAACHPSRLAQSHLKLDSGMDSIAVSVFVVILVEFDNQTLSEANPNIN